HVDGELARYQILVKKQEPNYAGEYLDLLVHKWVQPLTHLSLGIALFREFDSYFYLYLGIFASASYVGWTRSTATNIIFKAAAMNKIDINQGAVLKLANLSNLKPDFTQLKTTQ